MLLEAITCSHACNTIIYISFLDMSYGTQFIHAYSLYFLFIPPSLLIFSCRVTYISTQSRILALRTGRVLDTF